MPDRLQVEAVIEIQQPSTYMAYMMRRDDIREEMNKKGKDWPRYNTMDSNGIKTYKAQRSWTGRDMGELVACSVPSALICNVLTYCL